MIDTPCKLAVSFLGVSSVPYPENKPSDDAILALPGVRIRYPNLARAIHAFRQALFGLGTCIPWLPIQRMKLRAR